MDLAVPESFREFVNKRSENMHKARGQDKCQKSNSPSNCFDAPTANPQMRTLSDCLSIILHYLTATQFYLMKHCSLKTNTV